MTINDMIVMMIVMMVHGSVIYAASCIMVQQKRGTCT
jgi:hypothetical protein